jgi:V8-like Glu-specific endopeptidase
MAKRFLGTVFGAVLALTALAPPASAAQAVDFTGIVALSNCSGSVVKTPTSAPGDPALVMSNGHCVKLMAAGEVIVNQASTRTFSLLDSTGSRTLATLRATKIAYATMTDTDVSLYQLSSTYQQIANLGSRALELSPTHPVAGSDIRVVSGYWKKIYSCKADGFVYRLREANWTWKDSVRYTSACNTIGGTSGSPVVDATSGKVVAINNTGNESGERCTMNNPCEVNQAGTVTVRKGINYAQETYNAVPCIGAGSKITLTAPGCALPRP